MIETQIDIKWLCAFPFSSSPNTVFSTWSGVNKKLTEENGPRVGMHIKERGVENVPKVAANKERHRRQHFCFDWGGESLWVWAMPQTPVNFQNPEVKYINLFTIIQVGQTGAERNRYLKLHFVRVYVCEFMEMWLLEPNVQEFQINVWS